MAENSEKRFGTIAIEKGFITKDQFVEAMAIQIDIELEGPEHIVVGKILQLIGYMTKEQVMEVLESLND